MWQRLLFLKWKKTILIFILTFYQQSICTISTGTVEQAKPTGMKAFRLLLCLSLLKKKSYESNNKLVKIDQQNICHYW